MAGVMNWLFEEENLVAAGVLCSRARNMMLKDYRIPRSPAVIHHGIPPLTWGIVGWG